MDVIFDQPALVEALGEVERRCWLFSNLPLDPVHRDWLRRRAWVRTVHGSTRIEGNTLSDLEVDRLLDGVAGRHCLERTPWRSWARDLLSNSSMISRLDRTWT